MLTHRVSPARQAKTTMKQHVTIGATAVLAAMLLASPAAASLVIYDDGTGNDATIPEGAWTTTWQTRSQDENVNSGEYALHTRQEMASSPGQFRFNHPGLDVGANHFLEFYMNKDILSFYGGPISEPTAQHLSVQIGYLDEDEEEVLTTLSDPSHVYMIDGEATAPGFATNDDPAIWEHVVVDLTQTTFDPSVHLLSRVHIAPWGHSFSGNAPHLLIDDVQLIAAEDPILLGDMNFDGVVDTGDVAPFVLALTDAAAYQSQFGVDEATMIAAGDINEAGAFDTGDVAPFVEMLVGSGSASVPEPGSLALLGLGAIALMRRRR